MVDDLSDSTESRSSTPAELTKTDVLTVRLDELLEQYLELLDQYTTLREELSRTFSSGFFSLAQAQRTSNLGPARRYGEEYYDERMKAQRKIMWNDNESEEDFGCSIGRDEELRTGKENDQGTEQTATDGSEEVTGKERLDQHDAKKETASSESGSRSKTAKPKQDPAKRNPLTWFGILVPPALRQTQTQFVKAFEGQIPDLILVQSKLKSTERQIWDLRDQLDITSTYDQGDSEAEEVLGETIQEMQPVKNAESTKDGRSSTRSLASRPAHSKSHLLQLGD